jgi:hypothetical protein
MCNTSTYSKVETLILSEDCFELLLYLINTTLMEMDLSDSTDIITARVLMHAASIIVRVRSDTGEIEALQDFVRDHQVWSQPSFWEELFWGMAQHYRIADCT